MMIVYDSLTGNVERFVSRLGDSFRLVRLENNLTVSESFVIITYTIGFGNIPQTTEKFLEENWHFLKGVASSGNRVWGENFARAGFKISQKYKVPNILSFELSGTDRDIEMFKERMKKIDSSKLY